jgi:hypothetical protein
MEESMRGYFLLSPALTAFALTFALLASPVTAIAKERKVKLTNLTVTKLYDKSSTKLMRTRGDQQYRGGDALGHDQANQTLAKPKGKGKGTKNTQPYMTYEMKDAMISSYRTAPPAKGPQQNLLEGSTGFSTNSPSATGVPLGGRAPTAPGGTIK